MSALSAAATALRVNLYLSRLCETISGSQTTICAKTFCFMNNIIYTRNIPRRTQYGNHCRHHFWNSTSTKHKNAPLIYLFYETLSQYLILKIEIKTETKNCL
jgi:hypothetical protein